ncbi:MAG: putative ATPase [Bermanella sp.]
MTDGATQPLAARMRPNDLTGFLGQEHLLGANKPLREALDSGQLHSMIFWGPPGVGKTTLAKLIAQLCDAHFITLSAVLAGVKDIRAAIEEARLQQQYQRQTVLFVDEVHRFNKAQQDAFLPFVEDGTVIFVGATTENPSFELNNALLSRARVYRLKSLSDEAVVSILERCRGSLEFTCPDELLLLLAQQSDGDGRRALNFVELALDMAYSAGHPSSVTADIVNEILGGQPRRFDKQGDSFYDQISALHKAVRGSSPDASLYWFARMLDGGCDPLYLGRRLVRMASEDIGNADPRALQLALNAWDVQERLGSPEGELALAQAVVYLACAPKSNAVYSAFKAVMADVRQQSSDDVPLHLRNAPTKLMKEQGFGEEYRYAHDYPDCYAAGENYFPEKLKSPQYYQPVPRGLEKKISEKLTHLKQLDAASNWKRYP